ncbi:AraC family transcriptional regulator [Nocardia sp. NPDC052566]|uniref:AraC family transcriptional regulator n=1 Tax=Nocardia sp. NPDC052566 TaxID=3364330 RepID=UPI0037C5D3E4
MAVISRIDEPIIPPAHIACAVEWGRENGLPTDSWFVGTGIRPEQLDEPGCKLSYRQAAQILRRAVEGRGDMPVGMYISCRDVLKTFGMLGMLVRSCGTLGQALTVGIQMHQAAGTMMDLTLEDFGDNIAIVAHERMPDPVILPALSEGACSVVLIARAALGEDFAPALMQFAYPEPDYSAEYRNFFRCPIEYNAPVGRIVFTPAMLDTPIPTHNEENLRLAMEACRRLVDTPENRPSVVAAVEGVLAQRLRDHSTMADVARRLLVSERALRRQLAEAGARFSDIRDGVRRQRATTLVEETRMSIAQVAAEVGFSDAREFRRAYIRWTGEPPTAARRRHHNRNAGDGHAHAQQ